MPPQAPHWHCSILKKSADKIQFSLKSGKSSGTVHEDQYAFLPVPRSVLLRMRSVSGKSCRENQNTFYVNI